MPFDHRLKNCNMHRCWNRAAVLSVVGVAAADRHVRTQASRLTPRGYLLLIVRCGGTQNSSCKGLVPCKHNCMHLDLKGLCNFFFVPLCVRVCTFVCACLTCALPAKLGPTTLNSQRTQLLLV